MGGKKREGPTELFTALVLYGKEALRRSVSDILPLISFSQNI